MNKVEQPLISRESWVLAWDSILGKVRSNTPMTSSAKDDSSGSVEKWGSGVDKTAFSVVELIELL